jgi:serine/threonine protein kinase
VLLGKEMYQYKQKNEIQHKEMHSLSGVYIKEEMPEEVIDGKTYYSFMLIFPNKRRVYFLESQEHRDTWIEAIKKVTKYSSLYDFYEVGENLGKGKYGIVKRAVHKKTGKKCAVKLIQKDKVSLTDLELLKREIEVLKVCQH